MLDLPHILIKNCGRNKRRICKAKIKLTPIYALNNAFLGLKYKIIIFKEFY